MKFLPELEGTIKQKVWAADIRLKIQQVVGLMVAESLITPEYAEVIMQQTESRFWICIRGFVKVKSRGEFKEFLSQMRLGNMPSDLRGMRLRGGIDGNGAVVKLSPAVKLSSETVGAFTSKDMKLTVAGETFRPDEIFVHPDTMKALKKELGKPVSPVDDPDEAFAGVHRTVERAAWVGALGKEKEMVPASKLSPAAAEDLNDGQLRDRLREKLKGRWKNAGGDDER
jgi:hypothetical protein